MGHRRCDPHVHIVRAIERYPQVSTRPILAGPARLDQPFKAMTDMARPLGWHVEVIATCTVLAASSVKIASAGVPVVIDHYGLYGTATPQSPEGKRLLELFALAHVWVKLSGPYRVG